MLRPRFFLALTLFLGFSGVFLYAEPPSQPKPQKFVIHAIPKCGTHFIQHIVNLMTGRPLFNGDLTEKNLLKAEETGRILRVFVPWRSDRIPLLKKHKTKMVCMIRDPRDALISNLFYMRAKAGKGIQRDVFTVVENFDQLTLDDQLTSLMLGDPKTQSYIDFYRVRMNWSLNPYCLTLRYEELVGAEGGGSAELQRKAVLKLADYLGLSMSEERLQHVLDHMYKKKDDVEVDGEVYTRATTGNWKKFMTSYHKQLFKKLFNKELVLLGYEKDQHW